MINDFLPWRLCGSLRTLNLLPLIVALSILPLAAFAQAPAGTSPMKIGIVGSGNIGSTVGTLWVKAGHQVMFSSRNPGNLKQLVDGLGPLARAGTVAEALAFGDAVFVGVPYGTMPQLGKDYAKEFSGKIVLDAGTPWWRGTVRLAKPRGKPEWLSRRRNYWPERASCGRSIPATFAGSPISPTEPRGGSPFPWPAMIRKL